MDVIEGTGTDVVPGTLSKTESTVAGILLIPIAGLVFCKNNLLAFKISMFFLCAGAGILLATIYAYLGSPFDGVWYYMLTGVASYLAYVPYNSVLYERLIAALKRECTIGYLHAVMDATSYVGVFSIYLAAEFGDFDNHLDVFNSLGQLFGWIMLALWIFASLYFFIFRRNSLQCSNEDIDGAVREAEGGDLEVQKVEETENFDRDESANTGNGIPFP